MREERGVIRTRLVTGFVLERTGMGITMALGMGMELDVFGCTFKEMIMSSHCNVW